MINSTGTATDFPRKRPPKASIVHCKMKKSSNTLSDVRQALSGKQISPKSAAAIRGGDGESYPWVDGPGR